jgi:hypothetical protein
MTDASLASPCSDTVHALEQPQRRVPRWWLARRSPVALNRFRRAAGIALALHFAEHFVRTVPLLAWSGLYDRGLLGPGAAAQPSWLGAGLSPHGLRLVFLSAMLLGVALASGVAPRASAAALFGISVALYSAIFPLVGLSDYLANLTTLFLVLLPANGRSDWLGKLRPSRVAAGRPVSGVAATVLLTAIALVYLSGGLREFSTASGGRVADAATRMIPIAYILPVPGLRVVGVALQVGLHGYWMATTHATFANLILAASGILFWGEVERPAPRGPVIDAGAVIAVLFAGTAAIAGASLAYGMRSAPAVHVLTDLGLLPRMMDAPAASGASLSIVDKESGERLPAVSRGGPLFRRLVARLQGDGDADPMRLSLAASIARRHCKQTGYWGKVSSLVWSDQRGDHPVIEVECGSGGSLSRLR